MAEHRTLEYAEIVSRITDLDALTAAPLDGEKSGSATSHDRRSAYDESEGKYVNWHVNDDGDGFIRKEGEDIIMADLKGPGVIWRIWSAMPSEGHIKIYVDGREKPALDMPFREMFDNKKTPFPYSNLNTEMARGFNLFVPIAYRKSLKIALAPNWGKYFQAAYTTFPEGTKVPSFTGNFSDEDCAALDRANRTIAMRGSDSLFASEDVKTEKFTAKIAPGGKWELMLPGSGEIAGLEVKIPGNPTAKETQKILRGVALSAYWDGEKSPSVWAPLGDFFGSPCGIKSYATLPLKADKESSTMLSRWRMPFSDGAKIALINDGGKEAKIEVKVSTRKLEKSAADGLLRFHAKWHKNEYGKNGESFYMKNRWPDWPALLSENGKGRFAGMGVHVWNPNSNWNPSHKKHFKRPETSNIPGDIKHGVMNDWWWGEGDEKFFVDGEKFPSTFGTGFEDYIGYAWGTPQKFDSHTQAQPLNNGNWGDIYVARHHIADNVPFQKSFEAAIEKYHADNWPLQFAVTAYWYQEKGTDDMYGEIPYAERTNYKKRPALREEFENAQLPAQIEMLAKGYEFADFLSMRIIKRPAHANISEQNMSHWGGENWTNGTQLLITNLLLGENVVFEADAPDDNLQKMTLYYTQAPDYIDAEILVDGKKAGEIKGYAPEVRPAKLELQGPFASENGKYEIKIRPVSTERGTVLGLEKIVFER